MSAVKCCRIYTERKSIALKGQEDHPKTKTSLILFSLKNDHLLKLLHTVHSLALCSHMNLRTIAMSKTCPLDFLCFERCFCHFEGAF